MSSGTNGSTSEAFIALSAPSSPNCTMTPRDGSVRITVPTSPALVLPWSVTRTTVPGASLYVIAPSTAAGALVDLEWAGPFCAAATAGRDTLAEAMTSNSDAFTALRAPFFPNCTITPRDGSFRITVPVSPDLLLL